MGAFIIVEKEKLARIEPALMLFQEKGFSTPHTLQVGNWCIFAFSKMANREKNILKQGDNAIVAIGAPIYKDKGYPDTLAALLYDYCTDGIDYSRLIGQYTLLLCRKDKIEMILDPLGCKHVFVDENYDIFSSSMLAVAKTIDGKIHVNKEAVYEKLLIGMIMSPSTLFREVKCVDGSIIELINETQPSIVISQYKFQFNKNGFRNESRKKCIFNTNKFLLDYFSHMKQQSAEGLDMGLSGGYDSRLVLACMYKSGFNNIHLHTHQTENDHKKDVIIAKQMADYIGVPCHIVPTKHLNHCNNVDEIVLKSVLFYDGRSSFTIGGCGETYTSDYRKSATQNISMTLTGIGGELYRNVFCIGPQKYTWEKFCEDKLFSSSFKLSVSKEIYEMISKAVIDKIKKKLHTTKTRVDKCLAQRCYCEIMMPEGQGIVVDAYNQVSRCVAPFLDISIIQQGYETIKYHGSYGQFEGDVIDSLEHELATITSSYGYPLNHRPLKNQLKEGVRTLFSSKTWRLFAGERKKKISPKDRIEYRSKLCSKKTYLNQALVFFDDIFPEVDFVQLAASEDNAKSLNFIAATVYFLREKIEYDI